MQLYPYQRQGVEFAKNRNALIADQPGLGKSAQAIGIINERPDIKTVLIVCPASLKTNWKNELTKWLRQDFDGEITITNYEVLHKLSSDAAWDLLIVDECHFIKTMDAKRTVAVKRIATRCKQKLFLSGTPLLNRPIELFPILQVLDPTTWDPPGFFKGRAVEQAGNGGGFMPFAKYYCNAFLQEMPVGGKIRKFWNMSGANHLDELSKKLRESCMILRRKEDVLTELPPKRRQILNFSSEEYRAVLAKEEGYKSKYGDAFGEAVLTNRLPEFTEISKVRHEVALAKLPLVVEHVRETLEQVPKLVLFAHHRDLISAVYDEFLDCEPVVVSGSTPVNDRQKAVDQFQVDPNCRLFIGSISAAGVGLTLTASSHIVFAEKSWVPAENSQAEDRCHRIGQKESLLVQYLELEGSLDSYMSEVLIRKQEILDQVLA